MAQTNTEQTLTNTTPPRAPDSGKTEAQAAQTKKTEPAQTNKTEPTPTNQTLSQEKVKNKNLILGRIRSACGCTGQNQN